MKNINLYFDMEFTSLSPDAQPISLGIVSNEILYKTVYELSDFNKDRQKIICRHFVPDKIHFTGYSLSGVGFFECDIPELYRKYYSNATKYKFSAPVNIKQPKSFYAEFSDFDINRCDDWVKENVVKKLEMIEFPQELGFKNENTLKMLNSGIGCVSVSTSGNDTKCTGATSLIKQELSKWLSQFSDYQITFVCDCGTYDWYWMLQLLAEWDLKRVELCGGFMTSGYLAKTGLPKLPANISPVPQDLNDLIAIKKGISIRDAFDIERLGSFCQDNDELYSNIPQPHNALFDAKVIKATYYKIK